MEKNARDKAASTVINAKHVAVEICTKTNWI
jgi:hypothetical protein